MINLLLRLLLSFQLVFYSTYSQYSYAGSRELLTAEYLFTEYGKNLGNANVFNSNVLSLRKILTGKISPSKEPFYEAHPLDTFALLEQTVEKKIEIPLTLSQKIKRYANPLLGKRTEPIPEAELDQSRKKESFYFQNINPHKIFVEIENKLGGKISVIQSYGEATRKVLDEPLQTIYGGNAYITNSPSIEHSNVPRDSLFSFKISYQDQVLHHFPQNIKWIAIMGSYIIFQEPARVFKDKAYISFIDLKYFQPALGKTGLPVFSIPVHFNENILRSSLESPEKITVQRNEIDINGLKISKDQIHILSRMQQFLFNATVAFTDMTELKNSEVFIKDIAKIYGKSLKSQQETNTLDKGKLDVMRSFEDLKNFANEQLNLRADIGASQDNAGRFAILKTIEGNLKNESTKMYNRAKEDIEIIEIFSEHLKRDAIYQNVLNQTSASLQSQDKIFNRFMALVFHFIRPQPLGAPKIQKALGLISNTLLPGETIAGRLEFLKEGLIQMQSNTVVRFSETFLIGAAMVAYSNDSSFLAKILDTTSEWHSNMWDMITVTGKSSFSFVSENSVYENYLSENKLGNFLTGVSALLGSIFGLWAIIHTTTNLIEYLWYVKKTSVEALVEHNQKVKFWLIRAFSKPRIINYIEKGRKKFLQDMSIDEQRKIGMPMSWTLSDGSISESLFRTNQSWLKFIERFSHSETIFLKLKRIDENNILREVELISINDETKVEKTDSLMTIQLKAMEDIHPKRTFKIVKGNSFFIFKDNNVELNTEIHFSNKDFTVEGLLLDSNFSEEENQLLEKVISKIEAEKRKINQRSFMSKVFSKIEREENNLSTLTENEITTSVQALKHFFLGYSTWSRTFRTMGLIWNQFFLSRNLIFRPGLSLSMLFYSKYFKRIYTNSHQPSELNGGYTLRFSSLPNNIINMYSQLPFYGQRQTKHYVNERKQYLYHLRQFEEKIIAVEKQYLEASSTIAFYQLLKNQDHEQFDSSIRKGSHQNGETLRGKRKLLFRMYQNLLFEEGMKNYLLEQIGLTDKASVKTIKRHIIEKTMEENQESDWFIKPEKDHEIRARLHRIEKEKTLFKQSNEMATHFFAGFFKRIKARSLAKHRKSLDPNINLQMNRYRVVEKGSDDSEFLTRGTRQQMFDILVKQPATLSFLFLFLAGIDHGILKVVHEEGFSKEAWFHLSRFSIWQGFFAMYILQMFAGMWFKMQMDSRLDATGGFDTYPTKVDVEKKHGFLKWYAKQFTSSDNSFWANYKFSWKLAYANLPAAFINLAVIYYLTLGRFDIEAFLNIYVAVLIGSLAFISLKPENAFEKSANFVLKDFIKHGIDFNKQEMKKLLSHPYILSTKIKTSSFLRFKYNLLMSFVEPLVENISTILYNLDISQGSRGFQRILFFDSLVTEYVVKSMDFLKERGVPSDITDFCKTIFTKNRTDL